MTAFITPDYADRYAQARTDLAGWLREGRMISREDIVEEGVRAFPDALPKLFTGENTGRLILAVLKPPCSALGRTRPQGTGRLRERGPPLSPPATRLPERSDET
jgi:hypothetical protein